ncbi:hypothetical protein CPter91_4240 [Collimonas pratensis]|uniref:Uncharacterized protein n=1 Tax=Collimonas pratensis TaxID=279113 RepID=A0A127Q9L3_9BURK|nr:hypothetical protein CPter91_4240 [Collimonas pratensis]
MALVIKSSSFACRAERLARTGTGPNRSIVRPSSASKCIGPYADAGEEVALRVSVNVVWSNISYISFIYVTGSNVSGGD